MAEFTLPQKLQDQLNQYEQVKAQLQMIINQRLQLETLKKETESAKRHLEEIGKDSRVYKSAGSLLIEKRDIGGLKKELEENLEGLNIKITTLKHQEEVLKNRFEDLGERINQEIKRLSGAG